MSINDNSIQKNNEQQEQRKIINKMLKSAWEFCDAFDKIKPQYREQAIKELIGDRGFQLLLNIMRNYQ